MNVPHCIHCEIELRPRTKLLVCGSCAEEALLPYIEDLPDDVRVKALEKAREGVPVRTIVAELGVAA